MSGYIKGIVPHHQYGVIFCIDECILLHNDCVGPFSGLYNVSNVGLYNGIL